MMIIKNTNQKLLVISILLVLSTIFVHAQTNKVDNSESNTNGLMADNWSLDQMWSSIYDITTPDKAPDEIMVVEQGFAESDCTNGLDDDGDGLIDFYDPDCAANTNNYFGQPFPTCNADLSNGLDFTIAESYRNTTEAVSTYQQPLAADLDGDGTVEIIVLSSDNIVGSGGGRCSRNIRIFNGSDASLKANILTPFIAWNTAGVLAVADTDLDGKVEIFFSSTTRVNHEDEQGYIYSYELDSNNKWVQKWKSDHTYGYTAGHYAGHLSFADFNHDGVPEIYVYNQIFNAQTGVKLAEGGASNNIGNGYSSWGVTGITFAADFLPTNPGLELVAGNQLYTVDITNTTGMTGNTMVVERSLNESYAGDGFTAAGDFNHDGHLDVAISNNGTTNVYVWDIINNVSLGSYNVNNGTFNGPITLGDIDGDCDLEIIFVTSLKLHALEVGSGGLSHKWTIATGDGSALTGLTLFDFNQDNVAEIAYRDEDNFRIVNGAGNTATNFAIFTCGSGTGLEKPIVVDVDSDGQAEIVTVCGGGISGQVVVFGADGDPWGPARKVWNQYGYQSSAINDDLTIPRMQQNHAFSTTTSTCGCNGSIQAINHFMVQSSLITKDGCPINPASDTDIDGTVPTMTYTANGLLLEFELSNTIGLQAFPIGLPISIYDDDPTSTTANLLATTLTTEEVPVGGMIDFSAIVNVTGPSPSTFWLVLNDDGTTPRPYDLAVDFPNTNVAECDYTNNIYSFTAVFAADILVEGNGLTINDGDDTPSVDDDTNFGVQLDGSNTTHTFTLANTGTEDLTLSGTPLVEITNATGEINAFTVSAQPTSSVASGNQTTFAIDFSPTIAGISTAVVSIASNDVNENPFTFTISGTGATCLINLNDIVATDVCPGQTTGTITVTADCLSCDNPSDIRYSINGGAPQVSNVFENLAQGTYTVKIEDVNDNTCFITEDITITTIEDNEPPMTSYSGTTINYPVPATIIANAPEARQYELVYQEALAGGFSSAAAYDVNNSAALGNLDYIRIAYYLELEHPTYGNQWIWVSMDDFTNGNINQTGLPFGYVHDKIVSNMNVASNAAGIVTGESIATGNVEIWPSNYSRDANGPATGGSSSQYDFDDSGYSTSNGHGCFQVHNYGAAQTLFGISNYRTGISGWGLGIGNAPSGPPDWTQAINGDQYTVRNLYIMVSETPIPSCTTAVSKTLDINDMVSITPSDVGGDDYTDNCGIASKVLSQSDFDCTHINQDNLVTMTITDENDNTATCTVIINIIDGEDPVAVCPTTPPVVILNNTGMGTLSENALADGNSTDNCTLVEASPETTFDCSHIGTQMVILTATDVSNNIHTTSCAVNIQDNGSPLAICPSTPPTVVLDANNEGVLIENTLGGGNSLGNCGGVVETNLETMFDCSHIGAQMVTLTATDMNNQQHSTDCLVNVQEIENPVAICPTNTPIVLLDQNGSGTLAANALAGTNSTDNCTVIETNPEIIFNCSHLGTQMVTLTASDASNNTNTTDCEVTIVDDLDPVAICPTNAPIVFLDENGNGTLAVNALAGTNSTDNCTVTETSPETMFNCSHLGTQMVTLTATDQNNFVNSTDCAVMIKEEIAPTSSMTVSSTPPPTFPVPSHIIDNYSEASGYNLVYQEALVGNFLSAASYDINNTAALSDQAYDRVAYYLELEHPTYGNQWIWVSMDDFTNGNINQTGLPFGYVHDKIVSNMNVASNVAGIVTGEGITTGNVEMWPSSYSDNANGPVPGGSSSQFDFDDSGYHTGNGYGSFQVHNYSAAQTLFAVNHYRFPTSSLCVGIGNAPSGHPDWTLHDNGAQYTVRNIYIMVKSAPVINCTENPFTLQLDETGAASITTSDVGGDAYSDNCTIASTVLSQSEFDCDDIGNQTVTMTVTDQNDNASMCVALVTVQEASADPIAVCPTTAPIVALDSDGNGTLAINALAGGNSTGDCNLTETSPETMFDCSHLGTQMVTLTVSNVNNQVNSTDCAVVIKDETAPTAVCQSITVTLDANGNATLTPAMINNGSSDNCTSMANLDLSLSQATFDCDDINSTIPNNYALDVDGSNDWVDATGTGLNGPKTSAASLGLPVQAITVEAYVRPDAYSQWNAMISFLQHNGSFQRGWDLDTGNSGKFRFGLNSVGGGGNITYMQTTNSFSTNTWHHVAGVYDGTTMSIYVDGVLENTSTAENGDIWYADSWLSIGRLKDDDYTPTLNGGLDEVRIWEVARTQSEIQATMNTTLFGTEAGLVAYYAFEEGSGSSTVADLSGNGLNGILTNMDTATDWIAPPPAIEGATGISVMLTVEDEAGLMESCSAIVTVEDNIAPTFACPADMNVDLNETCELIIPDLIGSITVNDNCSATLTQDPAEGTTFASGEGMTQTVTITATDVNGLTNTTTCEVILTGVTGEISIESNSTEISDGDTSPTAADNTDFGTQAIGSMTDHTFTIKNTGGGTLNLTGNPNIVISGNQEFTIETQPSASSIASGGTDLTFVVRYAPTTSATHTATISIANNDCDESSYTFDISGSGLPTCSPNASLPTTAGIHLGSYASLNGDGYTYYCNADDELLFAIEVPSDWTIPADAIQLKIDANTVDFFALNCGGNCFIQNPDGTPIINRYWEVDESKITSGAGGFINLRHFFTQSEFDALNVELTNQSLSPLANVTGLQLYNVNGFSITQMFPTVPEISPSYTAFILKNGASPSTTKWVLGTHGTSDHSATFQLYSSLLKAGGGIGGHIKAVVNP